MDTSRIDGVGGEHIAAAARFLLAGRLLERHALAHEGVAHFGLDIDPSGDHDHDVDLTIPGLVHRYADAVCRRDADQWASCWAEDGVWILDVERRVQGLEPIVARWRIEMAKYEAVIQLVANGEVAIDGDDATGR